MSLKKMIPVCMLLIMVFGCRKSTSPDNSPPHKPHDPSPLDGAIDQPVNGDLRWIGGDPDGDPVTYDVYFGSDASPALIESNVTTPEYDPGMLDTFTTYYWRIISKDIHGVAIQGNLWQFKTGNSPPYIPGNPDPPDSSVDQSEVSTLHWSGGDPDGDTLIYYIYFGTASPPPWILSIDSAGYDPGVLAYLTTYYWKIVARDKHNTVIEGPLWSFTTWDSLPHPQNVDLSSDAEGDGVVLSWDQVGGIDGYEVTTPEYDTIILSPGETSYTDDAPSETGTYTICTFRDFEKSPLVAVSNAPFIGSFSVVLYVWSDPDQPAGFGWNPVIGEGSIYDCIDENRDSVDFYLNDSTAIFDFTSGDQSPYLGNKTTGVFDMGMDDFFEAPGGGYVSSVLVQDTDYYAMQVEGDYYAKVRVSNVSPGISAMIWFEFQKIQHLRIF
jgi:hypothetical protein